MTAPVVRAATRTPSPSPPDFVAGLGPTLVVAPHPDDESLGCGGLIALLRERQVPVTVLLLSDGTGSHPGSRRFPAAARYALRLREMRRALVLLGVDAPLVEVGLTDGALPGRGCAGFAGAVEVVHGCIDALAPATLLAPWRRDPHPDHRAASEIVRATNTLQQRPSRLVEYGVWLAERGADGDLPSPGEARVWRVDIGAVRARKLAAVTAHASQWGEVIDDDPEGFVLPPALRARAAEAFEVFYECSHGD